MIPEPLIRTDTEFELKVRGFFSIDKRLWFALFILLSFLFLYVRKDYIERKILLMETLEEQGLYGVIQLINGANYFSLPFWYLLKFTLIAFVIWVGSFTFGYKIIFKKVFVVVMISETIFFIPEVLSILYFSLVDTDPNLFDIRNFYPFSLINLVDYTEIHENLIYPFKAINAFEVAYWFILAYGLKLAARRSYNVMLNVVFSSYVLVFLLWLSFYFIVA